MTSKIQNIPISTIYNSRKNILDIMNSQDFDTNDYTNFSINEVQSMYINNQLDMLIEKNKTNNDKDKPDDMITTNIVNTKVYIRYYLAKKISTNIIQEVIDDLFSLSETLTKKDMLLIVIKDEPSESILNQLKHIWEYDGIYITVECIKRLQFNILNHSLVPKHNIISQSETESIMVKYNMKSSDQFPEISRFDPVARIIGLRPGQVVHIIRPSKTSITTDYYRICV